MMLVVCGSANSWMLDNLVNNHGGLYGRTTYEIKLSPFTLPECERFFASSGIQLSRYDITQANMILGGIPYYELFHAGEKPCAKHRQSILRAERQTKR